MVSSKRSKSAVIQLKVRMGEPLRAQLDKSARQRGPRGISLNAEIVNRLEQSFYWDKEYGDAVKMANKIIADAREVSAGEKDIALRKMGIHPVIGRPGHFVEIDKIKPTEMIELNPALETLIERIVVRTLEKAKQP